MNLQLNADLNVFTVGSPCILGPPTNKNMPS